MNFCEHLIAELEWLLSVLKRWRILLRYRLRKMEKKSIQLAFYHLGKLKRLQLSLRTPGACHRYITRRLEDFKGSQAIGALAEFVIL